MTRNKSTIKKLLYTVKNLTVCARLWLQSSREGPSKSSLLSYNPFRNMRDHIWKLMNVQSRADNIISSWVLFTFVLVSSSSWHTSTGKSQTSASRHSKKKAYQDIHPTPPSPIRFIPKLLLGEVGPSAIVPWGSKTNKSYELESCTRTPPIHIWSPPPQAATTDFCPYKENHEMYKEEKRLTLYILRRKHQCYYASKRKKKNHKLIETLAYEYWVRYISLYTTKKRKFTSNKHGYESGWGEKGEAARWHPTDIERWMDKHESPPACWCGRSWQYKVWCGRERSILETTHSCV